MADIGRRIVLPPPLIPPSAMSFTLGEPVRKGEEGWLEKTWEATKEHAHWLAAAGGALALSIFLRKPSLLRNLKPEMEALMKEQEKRAAEVLVESVFKDLPKGARETFKGMKEKLVKEGLPELDAVERALDHVISESGKKIPLGKKIVKMDDEVFDHLDKLSRWIARDIKEMVEVAHKEGPVLRFVRTVFPRWDLPELVLRRDPMGIRLYKHTVDKTRWIKIVRKEFRDRLEKWAEKWGVKKWDEETADKFLFFHEHKSKLKPEEIEKFPKWMREASEEYRTQITDPIHELASSFDPKLRYRRDYFTHYPLRGYRQMLEEELKRAEEELAVASEDLKPKLRGRIQRLRKQLEEAKLVEESVRKAIGERGYFGPLMEARKANIPYEKDILDVTRRYIDGAVNKIFLDSYLPQARAYFSAVADPLLRDFALDYIMVQKGAFQRMHRVAIGRALKGYFKAMEGVAENALPISERIDPVWVDKTVNFLTNLQFAAKVGLSWVRFPILNLTQPILTLWPIAGRYFLKGLRRTLKKETWEMARKLGVTDMAWEAVREVPFKAYRGLRFLSLPAEMSEQFNRVFAFATGLEMGAAKGLRGKALTDFAMNMVDRTQWAYTKAHLPVLAQHPIGRLFYQFKTFSQNYVNWLLDLHKVDKKAFTRAIASLLFLGGTGSIPFWRTIQKELASHGIYLPDSNFLIYASHALLHLDVPMDISESLNPFPILYPPEWLLGPTLGPALSVISAPSMEARAERAKDIAVSFFPPVRAFTKGVLYPTPKTLAGRPIGERSVLEQLQLSPSLEARRWKYMDMLTHLYYTLRTTKSAKRKAKIRKTIRELIQRARKEGIKLTRKDISTVKGRATQRIHYEQLPLRERAYR